MARNGGREFRKNNRHQDGYRTGSAGNGPDSGGQGVPSDRVKMDKGTSDRVFGRGTEVDRSNVGGPLPMRGGIRL